MFRRQITRALTLAVVGSLLMSTAVFADDVSNDLDATVDTTLETMNLTVGGAVGTTTLYTVNRNGDGKNGCNITSSTSLTLTITSSDPAVATVSPSTVTFGSCGDEKLLTVTPRAIGAAGSTTISATQTANSTGGTFNLAPVNFTVNVAAAAPTDTIAPLTTALVTSGTLGDNGWYRADPTVTLTATDNEGGSGVKQITYSTSGAQTTSSTTVSGSTASVTITGEGTTTVTFAARDNDGNVESTQTFSVKVDKTAPTASLSVTGGTPGTNSWYTSNVTVATAGTDAGSGIASCTGEQSLTIESSGTAFNGSCTDKAGNSTDAAALTVKLDKTAPTASLSVTGGTVGANGWYTSDVTVGTAGTDGGSGIAACTADKIQDTDTDGTIFNGSCTDMAGLTTNAAPLTIKLDKTGPSASLSVTGGTLGWNGWYTSDVTVTTSGTDATSGATCTGAQTQTDETMGETFVGSCTNGAGLKTDATALTVKLDKSAPVITPEIAGTAGTSPWYTSDVDVEWTVADSISGVASSDDACSEATSITEDSDLATEVTCGATNEAGLSDSETVSIKKDGSAPVISKTVTGTLGSNGWYIDNVTVDWAAPSDAHSGIASVTGCADVTYSADTDGTPSACEATNNAGLKSYDSVTVKRDATKPTISGAVAPVAPDGTNSWYKTEPTVTFACGDATSGIASCLVDGGATNFVTLGESSAAQTVSGTAIDNAGHTETASVSGLKVDLTAPTNVAFVGGPAANSSHYFGTVPAAPTCTAQDAISQIASCVVSGYGTTVGTHTMTATATDNAGHTATATRMYTVLAWTIKGFYQPVDMNDVVNMVKGGSTVPLKFEIFAGSTELTTTASISSFKVGAITCGQLQGTPTDEIELYSTGGTSLRYDTTGGQFIQNWQTPRGAGVCYKVTMTALDGSSITAYFKTK